MESSDCGGCSSCVAKAKALALAALRSTALASAFSPRLKKFKSLEGEGFGEAPKNLAEIAANIEGFKKRMNALLEVSDMTPGSKFLEGWKMGFCQVASQVAADSSPSSREPPRPVRSET